MPYSDLPIDELRAYRPNLAVPADLDAFWDETLRETRSHASPATFTPVDNGLTVIRSFDVTFAGFGGSPVRGWLHLPAAAREPLPGVVEYIGYGGGRGLAHQRVRWAAAGFAHFVMDTRGQGSTWMVGHTPDPDGSGAPAHPGFMTRGILDPRTYYYRRVIADAVRAVEAVREHPARRCQPDRGDGREPGRRAVDRGRRSRRRPRGGHAGRAVPVRSAACARAGRQRSIRRGRPLPARPSRRGGDGARDAGLLRRRDPRSARDGARALLGRAHGYVCPPSTVYAAYNWYGAAKEIREYAFNDHEGGDADHEVVQMGWLRERLTRP